MINGLVYVSGAANTWGSLNFKCIVIVGVACSGTETTNLTYQPGLRINPPPGFSTGVRLVISDGTWRQVVDTAE